MPKNSTYDPLSYEEMELFRTRDIPSNRASRRKLAKRAGVRFKVINPEMAKTRPLYLGIRQFKKATRDKKLVKTYKDNAHHSKKELDERRAKASKN